MLDALGYTTKCVKTLTGMVSVDAGLVAIEHSFVGESKSNGAVESAIGILQRQV